MVQTSHWPLLVWFGICLVLSIWGAGLNPLGKPRWVPPRIMFAKAVFKLLDFVFLLHPFSRSILRGKKPHIYFRDYHREHNTFVHRHNAYLLRLSDHESLTLEQEIERTMWVGSMIVSGFMVVIIVATFLVRALL